MELILQDENGAETRKTIFISHANPSDNDFTKWLSLKLISFGYNVWSDILSLDKGKPIWQTIEPIIRINTCRFLVVLSEISNTSEGVLNEIAVASKVKKELKDDAFMIPLLIDEKLPFDKINIELNRLNTIDFRNSWAIGLQELLTTLEKSGLPKTEDGFYSINQIFKNKFLKGKKVIKKDDLYHSNWFPIKELPQNLYFHAIGISNLSYFKNIFTFPYLEYKNHICTFSEEIGNFFPSLELFENSRKLVIPISSIMDRSYNTDFVSNDNCRKILIQLFNNGLNNMFKNKKLQQYELSGSKIAYWFKLNQIENNKINNIKLVGDFREYKWHYGATGLIKLFPSPLLILTSHIFFTSDGKDILESKVKQHKYRRRLGATWYNNTWRNRMFNFIQYFVDSNNEIIVTLGSKENLVISSLALAFPSDFSYFTPKDESHSEDIDISILDFDDEDDSSSYNEEDGYVL